MKKILAILGIGLLVLLLIVLALPLWIGPVACLAVNQVGPRLTGTPVSLGSFALNPYTGTLRIGEFRVGNPDGYSQDTAASVGSLVVQVEPLSLLGDTIRVRQVKADGIFASYVGTENAGLTGTKNVDVLMENVLGPAETNATVQAAAPEQAAPASERKIIVDLVSIDGLRVQVGPLTAAVPVPEIRDIGVSSGGVSMSAAWNEVLQKVMDSLGSAGGSVLDLGKQGLGIGQQGLSSALESAKQLDLKGAEDALKSTGKSLEEIGKGFKGLFK